VNGIGQRLLSALFLMLFGVTVASSNSHAAGRVALVIGNAAYENTSPLRNPRNDAEGVAAALERLGFNVITGFDTDRTTFAQKAAAFAKAARSEAAQAWASIKDTDNERMLEVFIRRHPDSVYAEFAKIRLEELLQHAEVDDSILLYERFQLEQDAARRFEQVDLRFALQNVDSDAIALRGHLETEVVG